MSLTFPAAFCFQNAADTATITASSALPLCPPSLLQNPHTSVRWCAETDTAYLTVALAAAITGDTFGLHGLNLDTTGVTRIRASLADVSAVDGAVYDSGSAAGRVSAYYGNLVGLMPAPASFRYVRFDLSQAGIARLMAGYTMIGLRNQVATNFSFGAQDTPIDPSVVTTSRSGADHIDPRIQSRQWEFNFENLTEAERFGWVEDMKWIAGVRQNVMVIRNCASSNLGRDTLCGRITTLAPAITAQGFLNGAQMYAQGFSIKQRL